MDGLFKLEIKSAEGILFEDDVFFTRINTSSGDMGIYNGHTFTISDVLEGVLEYYVDEEVSKLLYISEGIVVVKPDHVLLTVDYIKKPADFDVKDLKNSIKESNKTYKDSTDYDKKMVALKTFNSSENKLRVAISS